MFQLIQLILQSLTFFALHLKKLTDKLDEIEILSTGNAKEVLCNMITSLRLKGSLIYSKTETYERSRLKLIN